MQRAKRNITLRLPTKTATALLQDQKQVMTMTHEKNMALICIDVTPNVKHCFDTIYSLTHSLILDPMLRPLHKVFIDPADAAVEATCSSIILEEHLDALFDLLEKLLRDYENNIKRLRFVRSIVATAYLAYEYISKKCGEYKLLSKLALAITLLLDYNLCIDEEQDDDECEELLEEAYRKFNEIGDISKICRRYRPCH